MLLKQSATTSNVPFLMVSSADHITGATGLTVTTTLSKNGAAFASTSASISELSNGWYTIALASGDVATIGALAMHCTATSGADPTDVLHQVVAFDFTASTVSANVQQWAGFTAATTQLAIATTAPLATTGISGIWTYAIEGTTTAEQSLRLANSANGAILSGATTTVIHIRDLANSKDRILASGDAAGNRLAVTLDLT